MVASDNLRHQGGALVGLASHWPDHKIVEREYRNLQERSDWTGLLVCVDLWLLSTRGTRDQIASAFANFVTRSAPSPWHFPAEALEAFQARVARDPEITEILKQQAMDIDEPSIRASTVRLLASMLVNPEQDLTKDLITAEAKRLGPPRFALDIITNRIQTAMKLMQRALSE